MSLNNLAFVDVETTGSRATHDRIIEIGILRVENGEVVRTYDRLINPQTYLSPFIASITGIQAEDLEGAPTFEEIKEEVLEMLDGCIFVAHNVRFDYSFVKNEFRRFGINFSPDHFCTVKLSRKLFPQYTHHGLDALMERFQLECENRHRAYGDAKVVWDFYQRIHKELPQETIDVALAEALKKPAFPQDISPEVVDTLPEEPGVYIFYGEDDMPLYVGKSINIRDRVISHFTNDYASSKDMNISQQIKRIETVTTAGELGALLKESTLIKQLQPIYNRLLRQTKKMVLARSFKTEEGYQSIKLESVTKLTSEDTTDIVGVFRSQKQAKDHLAEIATKHELCEKLLGLEKAKGACFSHKLGICHGACVGEELPAKYNMRFAAAFTHTKVKSWPFTGPIMIKETNEFEQKEEVFMVDKWCLVKDESDLSFDFDTYKILVRYIFNPRNSHTIKVIPRNTHQEQFDGISYKTLTVESL